MEKNTIWAVVLSTIVLVGSMFIQTKFFPTQNKQTVQTETVQEKEAVETQLDSVNTIVTNKIENVLSADEETAIEEFYTIKTNKVEVVFSTRGGDIISYKLLDHFDRDTSTGVELSDNVSELNRTCSIAFGGASNSIINEVFTARKLDDYTIGFYKTFLIENSDKTENRFTLYKTYSFKPDEYAFKLDIAIEGAENSNGLNFDGIAYTIRTSPQLGPHFDKKADRYESRQFIAFNGEKAKKIVLSEKQFKVYDKENVSWAGIGGKYFVGLIIPTGKTAVKNVYYSSLIEKNNYANAQALVERSSFTGKKLRDSYYLYLGPRNEKDLRIYNVAANNKWNVEGLRLGECLQSSGFLSWLETILKWMMEMIYKVIPNWGVSIIILTILLKLVMFPLTKKSSMGTQKMQEMQPRIQAIQAKYKDNPQKMQQETAKLYKEAGYNPVSGCLPMVFMFVVLFAMFNLFNNYFEFRGAMFIPGWIPDLSAGDSIYRFNFNIPFIGSDLRLLPIIYVISQLLFGKITQNGGTMTGSNAAQMKMMMYGMPLIFFFLFYNAPSGLILYWTVSNFVQLIQQLFINAMMKKEKNAEKKSNVKKFRK